MGIKIGFQFYVVIMCLLCASCGGGSDALDGDNSSSVINENGEPNSPPVAIDDEVKIYEDEVLSSFNVLTNDFDVNSDILTLTAVSETTGEVTFTADGAITYSPPSNFYGSTSITYEVSDGTSTDSGELKIGVLTVNDSPKANDDLVTVQKSSSENRILVLSNDIDVDDNTLKIVSAEPSSGVVTIQGQYLLYTPIIDFTGNITIFYTIEDSQGEIDSATVVVTISPDVSEPAAIRANISASRTECASPCTVVFSADKTEATNLDEHGIWSQLIYYWDFDSGVNTQYGSLYTQHYVHVAGDSSFEIGGPMATKTFLCDVGTCDYNVGLRAQNEEGEFDDVFIRVVVNSESTLWAAENILCVSNSLPKSTPWNNFDKACPLGATKLNAFPDPRDYGDKLVLFKRGDSWKQNVITWQGESNFKLGYFGNASDPKPEIIGKVSIGAKSDSGSQNVLNRDLDDYGDFPKNVTIDGLRIGTISLGMSYEHIGMHDLDMDWESSNVTNLGRIQLSGFNSLCTDSDNIDCDRVPFPKGAYISQVKMVGSETDEKTVPATKIGFNPVLNVAGIGCSMINYTGIVDTSMRRVGEHNIRLMGWYRLNIMRSELLGQHGGPGKQKITTRACIESDVVNDRGETNPELMWQNRSDLPLYWRQDLEGRTRQDQWFNDGTDDYLKLSRYLVVQSNIIGDTVQRGEQKGSTKVQTNVTSSNEHTMEDVLYTKNIFRNEAGNDSSDISAPALYASCVNNTYSDEGKNCLLSSNPNFGSRANPDPLIEPRAPGTP